MTTKKWLLLLGLAVLLFGVGGSGWLANHFWHPSDESPGASGGPAHSSDDEDGVVCTGYVDLERGVRTLAPIRPGRVAKVLVEENQHVEAGAAILRLEDDDARFQLAEAESALAAAEAQLAEALKLGERHQARLAQQGAAVRAAGFRLDAAREVLARKEEQFKKDLVTSEEITTTRGEVKALEALRTAEEEKLTELKTVDPELAVRKARAEEGRAKAQRDRARHQLDECTLKAPTAGTVHRVAVGAGDVLTGNPAQSVVRFCPDEALMVRAEVNQEFADRVRVGQSARIRDDTRKGTTWRGRVRRVAGWYERARPDTEDPSAYVDVRTVECWVSIDPGQPPLRLGQRMRVMIGRVPEEGSD